MFLDIWTRCCTLEKKPVFSVSYPWPIFSLNNPDTCQKKAYKKKGPGYSVPTAIRKTLDLSGKNWNYAETNFAKIFRIIPTPCIGYNFSKTAGFSLDIKTNILLRVLDTLNTLQGSGFYTFPGFQNFFARKFFMVQLIELHTF